MTVITRLLCILTLVLSVGCGKKESNSSGSSKELFSSWTNDSGGDVLDLTGMTYAVTYNVVINYTVNAGCNCSLRIDGVQKYGTATLSACTHFGPVNYCGLGTYVYDYTNESKTLVLCDQATSICETYR